MTFSKRTRFEVLRRDNFTCRYCRSADNPLTIDHVVPTALGGTDDPNNLVAACQDCNAGKAATSPDERTVADVAADAFRWSRAMRAAVLVISANRAERDQYTTRVDQQWRQWHWGDESGEFPRPTNWQQTIWRFYELGLPSEEVIEAVAIACGNPQIYIDNTWRYMCGIAWKRLAVLQEIARQQLEWTQEKEG